MIFFLKGSVFEKFGNMDISGDFKQTLLKGNRNTIDHRGTDLGSNGIINRQLEIQSSHSLLNAIFYDAFRFVTPSYQNHWESGILYTAIIVEPRKHNALRFVLKNFLDNLDNTWNILIYHGMDNKNFLLEIKNGLPDSHRIQLKNLNVSHFGTDDYNKLLYRRDFYDNIPTEVFLIFQTDSMICKENKNYISAFIEYDYVGGPWRYWGHSKVGNGGLSLRRKTKMLELLEKCMKQSNKTILDDEDVFFSIGCNDIPIYKPNHVKAGKFSVETTFSDRSFGIHNAWSYLSKREYDKIKFNCPDVDKIRSLN